MTEPAPFEWYDYRALKSRNALISIVAGPPSIGKTFGMKLDRVTEGVEKERQVMWIRRNLTELRPAKEGFFDSIADRWPGFEFRVEGYAGQVKTDGGEWRTIIRFAGLSTSYQMKGTKFPNVDAIVYDECFAETGMRYLEDEIEKLRRLWITVNRGRVDRNGKAKTKLYLLGNAKRLDNPYFLEWGFDGKREWQKGRGTGGDVVLHLVDAAKYEQRVTKGIYGSALGDAQMSYAAGDYFIPDGGYVVDSRPPDSKPMATLVTLRGTFGLWEAADWSRMYVTIGALGSVEKPVVTFEPMAVIPGVVMADASHFVRKFARRYYRQGAAYFVTPGAVLAQQALAR